jgi:hypothetical protein
MASAAVSSFLLPHPAALCPPPLHLRKKTRRTTVHKRMLRRPTQAHFQPTHGPLDDIIATIKSDILESPIEYKTSLSIFNPLKAPATWAVTPLPVSRAPSDQPLTIRKNRNSRSSASGSSMGSDTTPWPAFDSASAQEPIHTAKPSRTRVAGTIDGDGGPASQRRSSRLRLFTNGFPRLRRIGAGETSATSTGDGDTSESTSPTAATSLAIMERVVRRLPSSREDEPLNEQPLQAEPLPTTLRAAIRVFPEVKVFAADIQDFSVAIEIEGVLSNRNALSDGTVDVIFLVDNG